MHFIMSGSIFHFLVKMKAGHDEQNCPFLSKKCDSWEKNNFKPDFFVEFIKVTLFLIEIKQI